MFGDNKGWKEQPMSMINFIILCLNVENGIRAEQSNKLKNKGKKK